MHRLPSVYLAVVTLGLLLCTSYGQWDPIDVPGHSVIVHLFEWKWNDVANECENWLGPHGFGGIQISVPTENAVIEPRPWWERYQPISYFFNTRSGDEAELADMIRRCNAAGVRIYPDILLNHMTGPGDFLTGTGGSTAEPDNKLFPAVPYGPDDFNPTCDIVDWGDVEQVRNCELVGLKDLNQGTQYVRDKLAEMLNRLIDMGVAGFRIDAAKHMWPDDMQLIMDSLHNLNTDHGFPANSRAVLFQEVIDNGDSSITYADYRNLGRVTEFKQGRELGRAFQGLNALKWLNNFGEAWGMMPSQYALVFMDNHDNQRHGGSDILTYKNPKPYKMATAFELAWNYGYPRMMSSFAFDNPDAGPPHDANDNILGPEFNPDDTCTNGWVCEHRWRQMYNMVEFRNTVGIEGVFGWWDNGNNQIAFCRGDKGFIAFNNEGSDMNVNLQTCVPEGTYCDIISGSKSGGTCTGKSVVVSADGTADIILNVDEDDGMLAIHINSKL